MPICVHLVITLLELDWGSLGNAYGLLRLPQMPELKGVSIDSFIPSDVDLTKLKYKEKSIARQRELKRKALEANPPPKFKKSSPWSKTKEKRAKRAARRQKKLLKAERLITTASLGASMSDRLINKCSSGAMATDGNEDDSDDNDTKSILEEYKKMKKLKGRKITAAELEDLEDDESGDKKDDVDLPPDVELHQYPSNFDCTISAWKRCARVIRHLLLSHDSPPTATPTFIITLALQEFSKDAVAAFVKAPDARSLQPKHTSALRQQLAAGLYPQLVRGGVVLIS
ncbi:ATP-dependent rRNA helicase spb4 [Echinococcus granulosus]|uniref:ATP-dependent rRNA helicase spb4 n=1 Tax=Echinococcus granulosus TaxID=6210 RepID=W6UBN2_ECHGR|nr:ATP-dependent rRNA helicase spb4 [Echinococcus granulosus]EUB58515.1 ATP-dependent rRNA helicase spb4 [Echinococcus granulosus]